MQLKKVSTHAVALCSALLLFAPQFALAQTIYVQPIPDPGRSFGDALNRGLEEQRRFREAQAQADLYRIQREAALAQAEAARAQAEAAKSQQYSPGGAINAPQSAQSDLKRAVAHHVLRGECSDAKVLALGAGDLDLAEQALRLCKPSNSNVTKPAKAPVAKITPGPKKEPTFALPPRPVKPKSDVCINAEKLFDQGNLQELETYVRSHFAETEDCASRVVRFRGTL